VSDSYWQSESEDAALQAEHGFIWKATIDVDLAGRRILDAGCKPAVR
jgi:hypothetical protein